MNQQNISSIIGKKYILGPWNTLEHEDQIKNKILGSRVWGRPSIDHKLFRTIVLIIFSFLIIMSIGSVIVGISLHHMLPLFFFVLLALLLPYIFYKFREIREITFYNDKWKIKDYNNEENEFLLDDIVIYKSIGSLKGGTPLGSFFIKCKNGDYLYTLKPNTELRNYIETLPQLRDVRWYWIVAIPIIMVLFYFMLLWSR